MMRLKLLICFLFSIQIYTADKMIEVIYICDDESEWPPYTFYQRDNGLKTDSVTGYSVDVIKEILARQSITGVVNLYPWKRALKYVEKGDKYKIALNASYNKKRAKRFYYSKPYYFTTPYYFYSKKKHPNGLDIKSTKDFKKYTIYGKLGYNYRDFQIDNSDIDATFLSYKKIVELLLNNRCDIFLERMEIVQGYIMLGHSYFDNKDLGAYPLPGDMKSAIFMLFPKNKEGARVREIVNNGLNLMEKTGRIDKLLKKYGLL